MSKAEQSFGQSKASWLLLPVRGLLCPGPRVARWAAGGSSPSIWVAMPTYLGTYPVGT